MRKATKLLLILSFCLILAGSLLFGGALTVAEWNWNIFSTSHYETVVHEIDEPFTAISVGVGTADVALMPSEDGNVTVTGYEQVNLKNAVEVKDGTLSITLVDTRKWYDHIGIHFEQPTVTVALPQGAYDALSLTLSTGDVMIPADFSFASILVKTSTGDVTCLASAEGAISIGTDTGDITVESITAGEMALSVNTGRIKATGVNCNGELTVKVSTGKAILSGVNCNDFTSTGNTGDLSLKNVIATGKLSVKRTTGDVIFDGCDASEIFVNTNTGDVKGTLLSKKDFYTNTSTGRIIVPQTRSGGRCEITTSTGDIKIEIKE